MMMAGRKSPFRSNIPGEPLFRLEIDPREVLNMRWEKNVGATFTDIKMTNQFDDFYCFKVKCTDNINFRVRRPVGVIDPKTTISIRVIQHATERPLPNKVYIHIHHMKCTAADAKKDNDEVKKLWAFAGAKPDGVIRMPISCGGDAFAGTPGVTASMTPRGPSPSLIPSPGASMTPPAPSPSLRTKP